MIDVDGHAKVKKWGAMVLILKGGHTSATFCLKIKEISHYMIDELMLLGIHLSNIKEREENDEKTETLHQE